MQRGSDAKPETADRLKSLCLVLPTFNEKDNIMRVIARIRALRGKLPLNLSLLIVDDGSTDGTIDLIKEIIAQSNDLQLIERPHLLGIGSAYIDGFAFGLARGGFDYFGEMDADLQHPPEALIEMCNAANANIDVIVASRYIKGGGSVGWALGRRIVSKSANFLTRISVRAPVADSTSGFRIISKRAVRGLLQSKLSTRGYAFQIESLYVYRKLGMTFSEVPYVFEERKSGETKLGWKEMARFAGTAIRLGLFGLHVAKE
jgi:dolichol-phosphate mannosyltransferase